MRAGESSLDRHKGWLDKERVGVELGLGELVDPSV